VRAERILAAKIDGLVSFDTSPFCVFSAPLERCSAVVQLMACVPMNFHGTGG